MPTGGRGNGGPWGQGPSVPPPQPPQQKQPDLDELLRRGQERLKGLFGNGGGSPKGAALLALAAGVLWLATGLYKVNPDEQGVVLRFGEYHRTTDAGLRYHLPSPIESVVKPKVTRVNRVEVGFRSSSIGGRETDNRNAATLKESLMLTGDENIVDINFEVQWKIGDAKKYLFNVRAPEETVKQAAESAMREVIGRTPIAKALAEGRSTVEQEAKMLLQQILDSYDAGVEIVRLQMLKVDPPSEVIDAFRDVQTARADRERLRNEAEAYSNDIIPKARGQAERLLQESKAYKQEVVSRAEGEAGRFSSIYTEYKQAQDVTRKRMYLETMEQVLQGMNKIIIDKNASGPSGVVPYLPLPELKRNEKKEPSQ